MTGFIQRTSRQVPAQATLSMPEHVGAINGSTRFLHRNYIKTHRVSILGSGKDWVLDDLTIVKPRRIPYRLAMTGLLPSAH